MDPCALAFAPDGQTLVSGGFDGTVRWWDVSGKNAAESEFKLQSWIHTAAFSRDSKYAAVLAAPDHLVLWDVAAKREVATQDFANSYEGQIDFSPDGKKMCATSAGVARWFAIPSLRLLDQEPADRLSLAEDGSFAILARNGQIVRRDFSSGLEMVLDTHILFEPNQDGSTCSAATLSPDGESFVVAGEAGKLAMWNTRRAGPPFILAGHKASIYGVAFSADGKLLASASWDGSVGLWDRTGRNIKFLRGHTGAVWNVAFSRDSRTLASSGDDGAIKLWNLVSLQEAATLQAHEGPVSALAFSADGRRLISGGGWTVRLWSAPTFEEITAEKELWRQGNDNKKHAQSPATRSLHVMRKLRYARNEALEREIRRSLYAG